MGLIAHNAKMAMDQRAVDSQAAGKRMDDLAENMAKMFESMKGMSAQLAQLIDAEPKPTSAERPKSIPRVSKTPRVEGAKSVAAAVAVVENARAQADTGAHAPAGM